jgi:hypothetical protein
MKSVTNQKLIKRNARIGQITSIGALVILGVGLFITFKYPDKFVYSLGALLLGFILSQVGIFFGNRWGRSPRPDEIINKSLKGFGREFTVYHYVTPTSHLLVGPAGIWTLLPLHQSGTITYEKKRWRVKGGGFVQTYLRAFGQEGLGRPDQEAGAEIESVRRYLKRILPEGAEIPEIYAVLLFIHPKVELKNLVDAPLPALKAPDLKDFLREKAKEKPIGTLALEMVSQALPKPEKEE